MESGRRPVLKPRNFDSRVDLRDFLQFRGLYNATGNGVEAVPEPNGLAMISLVGWAFLVSKRRRKALT